SEYATDSFKNKLLWTDDISPSTYKWIEKSDTQGTISTTIYSVSLSSQAAYTVYTFRYS
uniref:Uncharacterized protein n=1 Tax=Amphimedon queenslandica TaxID=400682 RepID=A0A1X7TD17_AMPQE